MITGAVLLLLAGCGIASKHDHVELDSPLSSTAVVGPWTPGAGFLIDRTDRLMVASKSCLDKSTECEVSFPVIENGKALVRKDPFHAKAQKIKARVIGSDPEQDVIILQLASVPEDVPELKLAANSPAADATVRLLGIAPKQTVLWAYTSTTVKNVAPLQVKSDKGVPFKTTAVELNENGKLVKGFSGGPVVDEEGLVVGMVAGEPLQTGNLQAIDVAGIRSGLAKAYRHLGKEAFKDKDYKKAIAYYDRGLACQANDAFMLDDRGFAYLYLHQYDKAIEDCTAAIKLSESLGRAYRNRSWAYLQKGKYKEAVADSTRAIDFDDKSVDAYRVRCEAYEKLGLLKESRHDQAIIEHLTKTIYKPIGDPRDK